MLKPLKHLAQSMTMEAIAFQSGAFFKELQMLFEPHCRKGVTPKKGDLAELAGQLDKVVFKYVGVNAAIEFAHSGSCMYPPDISTNNVILGEYRNFFSSSDGLKYISREGAGKAIGTVNLEKSELTGFLAKIPVKIIMDIDHFVADNFTPGEFSAVLMHEIGHYFTYCELLTRTIMTNQVLAGVERVMRDGDAKQYEIALKKAGEVLDVDKAVIQDLSNATDKSVVLTVLATEAARDARTTNGYSIYDQTTWEMMSDQFATRHGAGRDLATALDKIYARYGVTFIRSGVVHAIVQALKIAFNLFLIIGGGVATVMGQAGGLLMILVGVANIASDVDFGVSGTYDKPQYRAARIKQQLVEWSKDPHLSKDMAEKVIEDIRVIDEMIKNYSTNEAWFSIIMRKLIAPIGRRYDNVKFQQQLEAMAANNLFVRALELQHI